MVLRTINVRYPKLKKSYHATAKDNQDLAIRRLDEIVDQKRVAQNSTSRGGSLVNRFKLKPKKIETFAIKL